MSTKNGQEILINCVYHIGDEGKNLSINPVKGVYKCWVCDARGGVHSFLKKIRDDKYITDIDIDAVNRGGGLSAHIAAKIEKSELPVEEESLVDTTIPCVYPDGVVSFGECATTPFNIHRCALKYLEGRGMAYSDIEGYKLHVGTNLSSKYFGRVFFPVFDEFGSQLRYWVARTTGEQVPKVLNASGKYTLYSTSRCLFNEHKVRRGHPVAICEGVFDAFSVDKHIMVSVALLGKDMHPYHVAALHRKAPSAVYICLDGEALKEAHRIAERLLPLFPVYIVRLPKDTDPNDAPLSILERFFEEADTPKLSF
jgi:DNA primase